VPLFEQISLNIQKNKKYDGKKCGSPVASKFLGSPKHLSKFLPVSHMVRQSALLTKLCTSREEEKKGTFDEKAKEVASVASATSVAVEDIKEKEDLSSPMIDPEAVRLPNMIKLNNSVLQKEKPGVCSLVRSPSLFLRGKTTRVSKETVYCECGNICDETKMLCSECSRQKETVELSGYLYLKTKSNQMKRYWYTLLNRELHCMKHAYKALCRLR
jgi:hypothetical protein